jgi:hypothetical protein
VNQDLSLGPVICTARLLNAKMQFLVLSFPELHKPACYFNMIMLLNLIILTSQDNLFRKNFSVVPYFLAVSVNQCKDSADSSNFSTH